MGGFKMMKPGRALLCIALCAANLSTAQAPGGENLGRLQGYVTRYIPAQGGASLSRDGKAWGVKAGMPIEAGDQFEVKGDAQLELRMADRLVVLNDVRPSFVVKEVHAPLSPRSATMMEALRSLLVKTPAGFAHSESKGGADCTQEAREAQQAALPLRAAAALAAPQQTIPLGTQRISLAWVGGIPPYRLAIDAGYSKVLAQLCLHAVDALPLGDGGASSTVITVQDGRGQRLSWRLKMVGAKEFAARQRQAGIAPNDDVLSSAIDNLRASDAGLHLAGYSMLTAIGEDSFLAWRLSAAVKAEELGL